MIKTASGRWTETINYLNASFPLANPRLGDHINTIVTGGMRTQISEQLALGKARGVHANTDANKGARKALRGLLLCQRVYFSDLWAKSTFHNPPEPGSTHESHVTFAYSYLDPNWKTLSLNRWGMRDEATIRSAIGMFAVVPNATAQDVSDVAKEGPPSGNPPPIAGNLNVSRTSFDLTGPSETCYRGVLAWLLKAGVVSFRWFMKNPSPTGKAALDPLFGDGVEVWPAARPFKDDSVLPLVEAGWVVHMWKEDSGAGGWNGHWVISNGDGTVCGVNNGEVDKPTERVIKAYTNNGTLRSQFEGYGGYVEEEYFASEEMMKKGKLSLRPKMPLQYSKSRMVKFDPLALPGRM